MTTLVSEDITWKFFSLLSEYEFIHIYVTLLCMQGKQGGGWGADTTVLTKLPVWSQLLAGCCICSREHKQIMLAERYEKMLCGVDKGFQALLWSKLQEVNRCIDCSLFWTRAWNAFHVFLEGTGPLTGRGRCFASSGAADFLGHLANVEWKWQVYIINVVRKGLCLHSVVLCCPWSQSRTILCGEWYPNTRGNVYLLPLRV